MHRGITLLSSLFLTFTLLTASVSAETSKKDEAIRELLQVMNTIENMEASLSTMKDTIKMNSPYFLKEVKVIMAREMKQEDVNVAARPYTEDDFGPERLYEIFRYKFNLDRVVKEIMLPVYQDNYSEAEIRQLIDFYKSELGQKTLKLNPTITREISSKTRDMSQMALNQAKEELAYELRQSFEKK